MPDGFFCSVVGYWVPIDKFVSAFSLSFLEAVRILPLSSQAVKLWEVSQGAEGTITRVSCNPAFAQKKRPSLEVFFENTPTCYRAPRWPDPEFPRKIRKKYVPWAEILDSQKILSENTPKIPKRCSQNTKNAQVWVFFRCFQGIFSQGFRISAQRVCLSAFFVEIPGRGISGLCSRSGRSQGFLLVFLCLRPKRAPNISAPNPGYP